MSGNEPRVRSGEHLVHEERLLAIKEAEVAAAARQALLIEQLLAEVRGLREDIKVTTGDVHSLKVEQTQLRGELSGLMGTVDTRLKDHDRQLSDIWGKFDSKQSAWAGVVPNIIGTIVAQIVGLSILGGVLYSLLKGSGATP